jgi:hypothetical protein
MIYVFLDVLLERLNKDLDAALLTDPQKRVIVTTVTRSRVLRKRGNNDKATLLNEKKATVSRKYVKKRENKEKGMMTNICAVNRHIRRRSKLQYEARFCDNRSVKFTCKDLPVELPMKRRQKVS